MAKQSVIIATENRQIRVRNVPVESEYLFDQKIMRAWFTLRLLYADFRNKLRTVVDERWSIPLSPYMKERYKKEEVEKRTDVDHRIDLSSEFYKNKGNQDTLRNTTNYSIIFIVSVFAFFFVLIAVLLVSKAC